MGVAVFITYRALILFLGADCSRVVLCGVPIVIGIAVYAVGIVLFKTIKKEDCLLLPKGEKLAKLLKL